jgi:hypothetical protein
VCWPRPFWRATEPGAVLRQNKVQYRHLRFSVIATEHFDVHFYEEERAAALDAARMAERAYGRLSRVLNHEYRERQPILLYASHSEFQQNNVTDIGDATGSHGRLPAPGDVAAHRLVRDFERPPARDGTSSVRRVRAWRIGASIPRLIAACHRCG